MEMEADYLGASQTGSLLLRICFLKKGPRKVFWLNSLGNAKIYKVQR